MGSGGNKATTRAAHRELQVPGLTETGPSVARGRQSGVTAKGPSERLSIIVQRPAGGN